MVKASKLIILFLVVVIVVFSGCNAEETEMQEYNRCTAICSSVLDDDFVTLNLCMEECKKEFPEER